MTVEVWLQLIQTVAVVIGIGFGLIQLRQLRHQRESAAGNELLRLLQAPDMADTVLFLHQLPDDLDSAALRQRLGDRFGPVMNLLAMFESLGPLVARGHVPLDMYAEYYRGPTLLCWAKLHRYVEEQRAAGWPTLFEWVEWLADRMRERVGAAEDLLAAQRFGAWRSPRDFDRLARRGG